MEHGLKDIKFYVQEHIAHWAIFYNPRKVCDTPLGAPAYVRLVYYVQKKQTLQYMKESNMWML